MRIIIISGLAFFVFLLACQHSSVQSVEQKTTEPQKTVASQETNNGNSQHFKDNLLLPSATEQCLAKIDVGEPFEFNLSINPYYLRGNFDGNNLIDYAIIIAGKKYKKNGLSYL
ncbi:MAG: hypothetical protein HC846_06880 [Blastocatellia bacterium]|nr:hypothetical protein [Blastocatellia bacterium]